jgi:hypothetical protein
MRRPPEDAAKVAPRRRAKRAEKPRAPIGPSLHRLDETFEERRFVPPASSRQYVGVVLMSLGAIALGAGVFAALFRPDDAPPLPYTPWLIAAGAVSLIVYFILGQAGQPTLRVGDLGVGIEEGERVSRAAWFQIERIGWSSGSLTVKPPGAAMVIPIAAHGPAAKRIVAEALRRIPERVEIDEGDLATIEAIGGTEGERVLAEPPQVTDMQCAASARPLTFERDVRMCARCGVFYHRQAVPARCLECDRKLRKTA